MANINGPIEYLKLFRLQTGATTAVAPIIGYLVMAAQTNYSIILLEILIIFVIGIIMHIFEFVLNEYIDLEVDRQSPDLKEKPLVKGTVSSLAALAVVIAAVIFSYIFAFIFFFDLWTIILLTLAFEFGAIYDIYGKHFAGSDFTLAAWIFFFCLFGASIVSMEFTGLLYLVAGLGFFQILFNNSIEGGLKDADHDATAGAKTLAHSLGVRVKNRRLIIPNTFRFASYSIKLAHLSIFALIIYIETIKLSHYFDYGIFILIIFLVFIILYSLRQFLAQKLFRRDRLKRIFSVHEIATFYIVPLVLFQQIGFIAVMFLLLLPLVWYLSLNLVLYGKPLEPRV
jgi:4-hydroxybenzoate polyprenyltransferase